jgi:hypothetical protein
MLLAATCATGRIPSAAIRSHTAIVSSQSDPGRCVTLTVVPAGRMSVRVNPSGFFASSLAKDGGVTSMLKSWSDRTTRSRAVVGGAVAAVEEAADAAVGVCRSRRARERPAPALQMLIVAKKVSDFLSYDDTERVARRLISTQFWRVETIARNEPARPCERKACNPASFISG